MLWQFIFTLIIPNTNEYSLYSLLILRWILYLDTVFQLVLNKAASITIYGFCTAVLVLVIKIKTLKTNHFLTIWTNQFGLFVYPNMHNILMLSLCLGFHGNVKITFTSRIRNKQYFNPQRSFKSLLRKLFLQCGIIRKNFFQKKEKSYFFEDFGTNRH